jgi:hypothetical protein
MFGPMTVIAQRNAIADVESQIGVICKRLPMMGMDSIGSTACRASAVILA